MQVIFRPALGGLRRTIQRKATICKPYAKKGFLVRADVNYVNAEEAKRLVGEENFSVLDVRDKSQYERSHIQSSYHIPLFVENKDNDPGSIETSQPILLISFCRSWDDLTSFGAVSYCQCSC